MVTSLALALLVLAGVQRLAAREPAAPVPQAPETPEEALHARRAAAQASERAQHAEAVEHLAPEWTAFDTERMLVLSHTDEKKARRVVAHAAGVLDLLDQQISALGPEEYMRRPILRVCSDSEERGSMVRQRGASTWLRTSLEVLACPDDEGPGSHSLGALNRELLRHHLSEHASETYLAMPAWLRSGLDAWIEGAYVDKHGKLEFHPDAWERDELSMQRQGGRGIPPIELFRMTEAKLTGDAARGRYAQTDALVRYLFSEECAKSALTRNLVPSYLGSLQAIVAEKSEAIRARADGLIAEAAEKAEEEPSAETETAPGPPPSPEEALAGWRRRAWMEAERELVEELWFRTFRSFEEKDWKSFEKGFAKFID